MPSPTAPWSKNGESTTDQGVGRAGGVFLLGAATGVGVTLAYSQHKLAELAEPDGSRRSQRRLDALTRVLELTPAQREAVGAILKREEPEVRARMRDSMERCGQSLRDYKAKIDAEIRSLLTPEQQKKFDSWQPSRPRSSLPAPARAASPLTDEMVLNVRH